MKILTSKFCSLSTSPSWQAWLFKFNANLYKQLMDRLKRSKGCDQNRHIMIELLKEIENIDGGEQMFAFLQTNYPHIIVSEKEKQPKTNINDQVFKYYNPNILTYPRRIILEGNKAQLLQKVQNFIVDKIKSDYVIINNRAYVEYLMQADANLKDQIPLNNWQIAIYRQENTNAQ